MNESTFLLNFFAAVAAALVMGYLAHRLHLPTIAGYLLAGLIVGPHTPGFRSDAELIRSLAEVGVAFLLFAVGTQVRLDQLQRVQRVALLGGVAQVGLTIALGALIGRSIGTGWVPALFFGALISVSSTTVAVKLLVDRRQLASLHGRIALAMSLVQDLLVLPLVLILPTIADLGDATARDLLIAVAKAGAILTVSLTVGGRLIPRLLEPVARTGSQELFIFAAISIALGSAVGTQALGVSAAMGAFLAGMAIAQGKFSARVHNLFSPFRDLFSIFFFISVGMLLDPAVLRREITAAVVTILLTVVGKLALVTLIVRLFRYNRRVSVMVGLYLAQVGELSFILAGLGLTQDIIDTRLYNLIIAGAVASIFLNPFVVQLGPVVFDWAGRRKALRPVSLDLEAGSD